MKKFTYFLIALFALIFSTGCEKTVIGPTIVINEQAVPYVYTVPKNAEGEFAITFGSYNDGTRATVASVAGNGYDAFKLFTWNSNNAVIMNPYLVEATGANAYAYTGTTNTAGQTTQYFSNTADSYDFVGVIPTDETAHEMTLSNGVVTVKDIVSFTADDERAADNGLTADSPEEFLYANQTVAKADYASVVDLNFNHGNALLYLGFKSDRNDTELLDYVPGTPAIPAVPATPDTETYTSKTTKFIDELVAGSEVQVAIGFYGAGSPKLTSTQPNPIYVGANNTSNGWLVKDWLLSIKDAVNAQFVYYRLDQVNNSTSKTEVTEDWDSKASNKSLYMMKLADGVDKAAFAAGNDVFWNALVAHESDWVGGSPAVSLKSVFKQAYDDGWRVVRINTNVAYKNFPSNMTEESTNPNQVLVFLSNNTEGSTQVCTITPGNPGSPAVPAVPGIDNVRVFSTEVSNGNYVKAPHTTVADAAVSSTGLVFTSTATSNDVIEFTLPATTTLNTTAVYSPTTFYAVPVDGEFTSFVVKMSYTYNGINSYDVRVPLPLPNGGLEAGKYYKYIINIISNANGTNDPNEATGDEDEVEIPQNNAISVRFVEVGYASGYETTIDI